MDVVFLVCEIKFCVITMLYVVYSLYCFFLGVNKNKEEYGIGFLDISFNFYGWILYIELDRKINKDKFNL